VNPHFQEITTLVFAVQVPISKLADHNNYEGGSVAVEKINAC